MKSSEWMNKLNSQIVLGQWEVLLLSSELKGNDKERRLERWFRAWKYRVKTIFKQQEGRWANIRDGQRSEGAQRRRTAVGKPSILKSRDITSPTKVHLVKALVFPVVMYRCEIKTIKKAECQRIDAFVFGVGEDSWESLDCKEIQPVHSEGDQSWVFFGRNDAKAETPVPWPPHVKSWLIGKDSAAGRD